MQANAASITLQQTADAFHESRLASPIGSDKGDHLAACNSHVHTAQNRHLAVGSSEPLNPQYVFAGTHC
ncbi:hypothetical protein D9M68_834310 [compost metagenome]